MTATPNDSYAKGIKEGDVILLSWLLLEFDSKLRDGKFALEAKGNDTLDLQVANGTKLIKQWMH